MNGKKAKEIRDMLTSRGIDLKTPQYRETVTKKRIWVMGDTGVPELRVVERKTIVNDAKHAYRRLKKMYKAENRG